MRQKILILLILVSVILVACDADMNDESSAEPISVEAPFQPEANEQFGDASETTLVGGTTNQPAPPPVPEVERLVIRNATLNLTVEDPADFVERVTGLVAEYDGWIVSSQINSFTDAAGEDANRANMTVRIPAEHLDVVIATLKGAALETDYEQITGEDVTAEFVDLGAQLGNLKSAEAQLQEIMDDAEDTEAVLAVYNELVRIRGEIDRIEGRRNYLQSSAAFSSIVLSISPPDADALTLDDDWNPGDTVEESLDALIALLQFGVDALIVFTIVLLPFIVVLYVLFRAVSWWRRRGKKSATDG